MAGCLEGSQVWKDSESQIITEVKVVNGGKWVKLWAVEILTDNVKKIRVRPGVRGDGL